MRRLLIRPGAIGDCILSFPAMEWLRTEYTEAWVPGPVVPLVGFADRVRSIASTGLDLVGIPDVQMPLDAISSMRAFDEVVSWYGTKRPDFREALTSAGVPVRFLNALPSEADVHAADFFAAQVGAATPAVPRIHCEPERNGAVWLHPYSGSPRKNWPYARFEELARRLEGRIPVEWAATPAGVRFENLLDLARHLAGGRLYIGNDSGVTHLAAAVGARVLALFGPTDPRVWAPRGERVQLLAVPSLEDLEAEQVESAAAAMLD